MMLTQLRNHPFQLFRDPFADIMRFPEIDEFPTMVSMLTSDKQEHDHNHSRRNRRRIETRENNRGVIVKAILPGLGNSDISVNFSRAPLLSKKDLKNLSSIEVPTSLKVDFAQGASSGEPFTVKLDSKSSFDIDKAKAFVFDGVLHIGIPKIEIPVCDLPILEGSSFSEEGACEESECAMKFAVAGFGRSDIQLQLDAENEKLRMSGKNARTGAQFERTLQIPGGLTKDHVRALVSNGILELRIKDPLAIEKRHIPVTNTLPNTNEHGRNKGEGGGEGEIENEIITLIRTEVPGYSSTDISCFVNVDRVLHCTKRNNRVVKLSVPNTVDIDSIQAFCEHGMLIVLAKKVPKVNAEVCSIEVQGPKDESEKARALEALHAIFATPSPPPITAVKDEDMNELAATGAPADAQ
jgi:HSP20 family molecular chaperone IbpA